MGIKTVEVFIDNNFGVFNAGESSIVSRLRKIVVATLLDFGKNNACKAKGDYAKKNRSKNDDIKRSDTLTFGLETWLFHKHIISYLSFYMPAVRAAKLNLLIEQ